MFNKLYSIAIDKADKKIYTCDSTNVIIVSWNGGSVKSVAKGRFVYGLTLDRMGSLYYGTRKTLMKMSLTSYTSSPVLHVGVAINNLLHYKDRLYFSSRSWTRVNSGRMGTVDVRQISVLRNVTKVLSTLVSTDRSMASRQAVLKLQSIQKILEGTLQDDTSIYDVISEMRQQIQRLEHGQHHLKRELHTVKKTLKEVQEENYMYGEVLLRAELKNGPCSCDVENGVLRTFMKQCERHGMKPKSDKIDNENDIEILKLVLETLNSTCQRDVKQSISSPSYDTTSARPTMPIPSELTVKNRLVVTPYLKSINQFVQLDIDSNTLNKYPLGLRYVSSMCFVEKLQRLLVAQNHPRIISTSLDSNQRETILKGVWALGMAVDEDRELVFMSTWGRIHAISRMSTTGENHTVVRSLSIVHRYPGGVAVNSRQREIYVSAYSIVFILSYDGQILQNLATGSFKNRGVAFDNVRDIVYFNKDKVLMMMSLSEKGVSEVITLPVKPFSLSFYNDTLYYGGQNVTGYLGAVQVGQNVSTTELRTLSWEYDRDLIICLVP